MTKLRSQDATIESANNEASETLWPREGFEERRAFEAIRGRLFGRPKLLHISRYRIERRLGAGAMGEVYLGYDTQLEREVAIKCVRPEIDDPAQHRRLRREAQALAQLSHPNVVQVYEVSEHEGQSYVAMEFIAGDTLGAWLERSRSWREILACFVAAGRGLAAAHAAGVIHRDFKPENVLIGADGRVRVVDFGLALAQPRAVSAGAGSEASQVASVTAGTVRYMPEEQLRGGAIDARCDQFAFCVALYEALYQAPPFALGDIGERLAALELDEVRTPGRGHPRSLWKHLRRGLRRDPDARWPQMGSLLDALEAVPRRRRAAGLMGVIGSVALGSLALGLSYASPRSCAGIEAELGGLWDPGRVEQAREAFASSGLAHEADSFARADEGLRRWSATWGSARAQQCEASHEGRDDEPLARARRACLERQRQRAELLARSLGEASPQLVDRAVTLVEQLPDPSACAAAQVLAQPALTPAQREQVEPLRAELAELAQLRLLGRAAPARAAELVARAQALAHPATLAEAVTEHGRSELAAGAASRGLALLERGSELALAADHEQLLAELWLELALHRLSDLPDAALGRRYAQLCAAQWAKLEPSIAVKAKLQFVAGRVAELDGEPARARAAYRSALATLGEDPSAQGPSYLDHLARLAEPELMISLRREALAAAEARWGPAHPETATYVFQLGATLHEQGRGEEAGPLLERARTLWTAAHRQPHPDLGNVHLLLAARELDAYSQGEDEDQRARALERAQVHAERAAALFAELLPEVHVEHGNAAEVCGQIAALMGDAERALGFAGEALTHWERALGPRAPQVLLARVDMGDYEMSLGLLDAANINFELVRERAGEDARMVALGELGLLELALRRGELDEAQRWIAMLEQPGHLEQLGEAALSFEIIRAIVDLRRGCDACVARVRNELSPRLAHAGWSWATISTWLEELGSSEEEARALGFKASD